MDLTLIYLSAISAVFALLLVVRLILLLAAFYRSHIADYILRHIVYPYLYRRLPILAPVTRFRAVLFCIYVAMTIFCNVYGISTTEEAASRAGWLSIANLVPVFITSHLSSAMLALGMSLQEAVTAHGTAGFMVVSQTIAHVVLEVQNMTAGFENKGDLAGFIVSIPVIIATSES